MAVQLFSSNKGDILSSALPSDTAALAGGSLPSGSNVKESGDLWMQTPAGGLAPAITNADVVVATALIPAGAFDIANRCITITANGNFAANSNNKTVKIIVAPTTAIIGSAIVGGTTIASTGVVTTSGSAWAIGADVIKTGATGSNTQTAIHLPTQVGAAVPSLTPCQALSLVESGSILVAITINNPTTASDATLWNFQGEWFN